LQNLELDQVVLFTKYYWVDQTKEDWAGYVALTEETNGYNILVPEPKKNILFLIAKCTWEASIKSGLTETVRICTRHSGSAQV
jgi:hypothetical protein